MITKADILQELKENLMKVETIYAMWLEGSEGSDQSDPYSDLDIVLDVEDGFEKAAFEQIEKTLASISPLDLNYVKEDYHPYLRDRVYHLRDTQASLLLDITVQSHSRDFAFEIENDSEVPKIIFDKKEIIKFKHIDEKELTEHLLQRLYHLQNTVEQKVRPEKYVKRNKMLEAFGYYQKYLLEPLIELLRMKYKPINHSYYVVNISKHLPTDILKRLENLTTFSNLEELGDNINHAYAMFYEYFYEIKATLENKLRDQAE